MMKLKTSVTSIIVTLSGFLLLTIFLPGAVNPQVPKFGKKIRKKIKKLPGSDAIVQKIIKGEPALRFGLEHAIETVPFLDDYSPSRPLELARLKRNDDNAFIISPGSFRRFSI